MRQGHHLALAAILCVLATGLGAPTARAVLPVSLVEVSLTDPQLGGAVTDDPSLAGYRVFDLRVTVPAGDRFHTANLRATLTGGTFYIPPDLDSNEPSTARNLVGFRYLKADTFVSVPILDPDETTIFGASNLSPSPSGPATFPSNGSNLPDSNSPTGFVAANDQRLVDAAWIDFNPIGRTYPTPGTYTIAQLTVPASFVRLDLLGSTMSLNDTPTLTPFSFTVLAPEPGWLATVAGVCAAAASSRRRRAPRA